MPKDLRYCVVCKRTLAPTALRCCTPDSVVRVVRSGWLRTRKAFYDSAGQPMDAAAIEQLRRRETEAARVIAQETSREWMLRFARFWRQLGFFTEKAYAEGGDPDEWLGEGSPVDFSCLSDEELAHVLIARYEEDWGKPVGAAHRFTDADILPYDIARVWDEDLECDVCCGNDVYVQTLREWARISKGAFCPREITETWGPKERSVEVAFTLQGKRHVLKPQYHDDWLDAGILDDINDLIAGTRYIFEVLPGGGQDALVFVVTAQESERIARERGQL